MQRFGSGGVDGFIDEVLFESVKLLAQLVLLQQVAEGQDRRLIWNPVIEQIDTGKATHAVQLDQCLPGHHCLHLSKNHLRFGLLFGGGELVHREAMLLVAHHPVSACDQRADVTRRAWVFEELPMR